MSRISGVFLFLFFAAFFTGAVLLQRKAMKNVMTNPPFVETWQLSGRSGETMKLVALRYDLVVADMLWLRSIQSFGGRGMTNRDWRPLYNLFDTITELDPYFEKAYTFGNMVIGDEGGEQAEGLRLLEKGTFRLYKKYRIPFEGMYVANWQMKDLDTARWYGRIAAKRPDAPEWVDRVTAYVDVESGEYYIGIDRFIGNLLEAIDIDEPDYQTIALRKAKEAVDTWNRSLISKALDEYTSSTGTLPATLDQVAGMPALQDYEIVDMSRLLSAVVRYSDRMNAKPLAIETVQDLGLPTTLPLDMPTSETAVVNAKSMADLQNVILRESLVRRSGLPPATSGSMFYLNQTRYGAPGGWSTEDYLVSETEIQDFLKKMITDVRGQVSNRREELGRVPKDLTEVFYTDFETTEPLGGQWTYDSQTGMFGSTSLPGF